MWICDDCGLRYGTIVPSLATYHMGICEWCGNERAVTEDRDFGYPPPPKTVKISSTPNKEREV